MNLDLQLVEQAKGELGTKNATETIHAALYEVVRRARIERLLESTVAMFSEPPPDGFDDWNEWIEASEDEDHEP